MPVDHTIDELLTKLESLQLQEATIIEQIKKLREKENNNIDQSFRSIDVGSRVYVVNGPIKRNLTSPTSAKDRVGTVIKVTEKRVQLTTDNGVTAWRAHKNVRPE